LFHYVLINCHIAAAAAAAVVVVVVVGHIAMPDVLRRSDTWRIDVHCAFPGPTATR